MIDKRLAQEVLDAALATGGDLSELYVSDAAAHNISMLDGAVENAVFSHSHGAGIRVFDGTRTSYAYTNATDKDSLLRTAKLAAAALKGQNSSEAVAFERCTNIESEHMSFVDVDNAARTALLKAVSSAAKDASTKVTQVTARYMDVEKNVLICNSRGVWAEDSRPRTRLVVQAVAAKDGEAQTGMEAPGWGTGFEAYKDIDAAALGTSAANIAVTMLEAPDCPAGFLPVVIDGGFGGVIFHEACGHSLEATAVSKGNSEFCGKLGQRVATERVTAIDDGTISQEWGSIGVDDEGVPTQRNVLIENGILKGYLIDELGSRRMGMPVTGSSRRQSYSLAPTSRMTNTYIAAGQDDEDEMIASMGDGLYAKRMGGGSVNPLTGEFNFAVLEGYWVKNGRLYSPVRGATLIGKGTEILMHIDRVGRHMWMGQGMCGSISGLIPTNVGQPRIRVDGITIGGKGASL